MSTNRQTIGIIGAGTMGRGIAQVAAQSGFEVILHDLSSSALKDALTGIKEGLRKSAAKGRITPTDATEALSAIRPSRKLNEFGSADFVIEAAVEIMDVKKDIFRKLDQVVGPETILASNTSSLSINAIASLTKTPESVVGMHFFNPAPLMSLVEIIKGKQTSAETLKRSCDLAMEMKKTPVVCSDTPGFIVNRVARPFYGEALRLLGEGVASVAEIDRIVRESGGFRMGPFELMDLIGIDINFTVTQSVYDQFFQEPRFRPHPIQRQMVESGTLGR
ncbi:MAG: 3-hydroxyacyl-CoA dehydrogenase NAD-binding domain-containing protein, partial [Ignavibacteria bacterium]|nr:3-hydroxyacyl-CoA dehydrogenase NAD-binding domain-containing protein [Ignavibacteria bacterium]